MQTAYRFAIHIALQAKVTSTLSVMPAVVVTVAQAVLGRHRHRLHLAQRGEPDGAHLESLVLHDLMAWRDSRPGRIEILHWRTTASEEVDFVIEAEDRLLPIEVKASPRPTLRDAAHLRSFRAEYGPKARAGLLLHSGDTTEWLAPDVLAAPWWQVF